MSVIENLPVAQQGATAEEGFTMEEKKSQMFPKESLDRIMVEMVVDEMKNGLDAEEIAEALSFNPDHVEYIVEFVKSRYMPEAGDYDTRAGRAPMWCARSADGEETPIEYWGDNAAAAEGVYLQQTGQHTLPSGVSIEKKALPNTGPKTNSMLDRMKKLAGLPRNMG